MFPTRSQGRNWSCCWLFVLLFTSHSQRAQAADPPTRHAEEAREAPQVQVDLVVATVKRGLARKAVFPFLKRSGHVITDSRTQSRPFTGVLESPAATRDFLNLIKALWQKNLAKVHAEPRLVVTNGQWGKYLAGGEEPEPNSVGYGSVGVQFEEFGLRLFIQPTVLDKGKVHVGIYVEVSSPRGEASEKTSQRMPAEADLKPGQTLLIGGMVQWVEVAKSRPIPVLGQLLLVGSHFCTRSPEQEEVETIVLITPSLGSRER